MLELVPARDDVLSMVRGQEIEGMVLLPTEESYAYVFDYLFSLVFRHKVSISEMLMEDSCALSVDGMRYFDGSLFGKIPSYSYWKRYFRALPKDMQDDIELTERDILKNGYVREMTSLAELSDGTSSDARLFNFWHKLHGIRDKEQSRIEQRMVKREMRSAGFNEGVDKTLEIIKRIKDGDLMEIKTVIEGVAKEVSGG